ncbi:MULTISPECIES: hypothetical protein [unclassified Agarivorans]|uniref:hypothetical protein n=1 Tax=unclassified Agarivorans TaxID=2636026 RepID=UPI0026E20B1F|nr:MULTISPECIES: hypothetical protein [unclassified Agarivorans]MDO6687184.1 hypothetical protein [Agarivorans sp. 3_MG-2023]MDO6716889.1 hypothetical protein [Agarivorans sp. 2_MG-2023]MDO6765616.1 hypothetical protein [Agarivorans sp. 1_MG-2023]
MTIHNIHSTLSPPGAQDNKTTCFNDNTRFFVLTVDFYADSLSLLAFGGDVIGNLPPTKQVAVNGEVDDLDSFFRTMFIWSFSNISEVDAPSPLNPQDWLLLDANEA